MGMDWHSSGITTSVIGALKRGLSPLAGELGLHVCGGRGQHSRKTPDELVAIGDASASTARRSPPRAASSPRSTAPRCRTASISICTASSSPTTAHWVVVQQGMNGERRQARRYHWLSEGLKSFVEGRTRRSRATARARSSISPTAAPKRRAAAQLDLLGDARPRRHRARTGRARASATRSRDSRRSRCCRIWSCRRITTCAPEDVHVRRLHGNLAAAAERGPADFAELLLTPGVGARTVRALALVAEVVHGAPCRFTDPARFSLAHGGKDRHPFPVPIKVYDETIRVLKSAVQKAKLGESEELAALQKLDRRIAAAGACSERAARRAFYRKRARAIARIRRAQRIRLGEGAVGRKSHGAAPEINNAR